MSLSISEPSHREIEFQRELRDLAIERIERDSLTSEQLAERLGMLPIGVEMLLERPTWTVGVGLRVAEALDLDIRLVAA
jgi:hypothetical protein